MFRDELIKVLEHLLQSGQFRFYCSLYKKYYYIYHSTILNYGAIYLTEDHNLRITSEFEIRLMVHALKTLPKNVYITIKCDQQEFIIIP